MNIAALLATALLAIAPVTVNDQVPTPTPTVEYTENQSPTVEYVPLDQVPDWYKTLPYDHGTGVCMVTTRDITCASDTQYKRVTLSDRYTRTLYKLI